MDLCNFVFTYSYGGIDWHDSYSANRQIIENNSPYIKDVKRCIIDAIISDWEDKKMNNLLDRKKIEAVYDGTLECYRVPMNTLVTDKEGTRLVAPEKYMQGDECLYENELIISKNKENDIKVIYEGMWGQYSVRKSYYAKSWRKEDVVFVPTKSFERCLKLGDAVEYMTSDFFKEYEDAVSFIEKDKENDIFCDMSEIKSGSLDSGYDDYSVITFNKNELQKNEWYIINIDNLKKRKELNINNYSKLFSVAPVTQEKKISEYKENLEKMGSEASLFDEFRRLADRAAMVDDFYKMREKYMLHVDYIVKAYGMNSAEYDTAIAQLSDHEKSRDISYEIDVIPLVRKLKDIVPSEMLIAEMKEYNEKLYDCINLYTRW